MTYWTATQASDTGQEDSMKKSAYKISFIACAAALLCACIPSVNPFYKPEDLAPDPRIEGKWQSLTNTDDQLVWEFEKMEKFEKTETKTYHLKTTAKDNKHGEFFACLFKIKGELFLDITPYKLEFKESQDELANFCLIPGHLVYYISQIEPTLKISRFDFKWLENTLKEHPEALAHTEATNNRPLVLMARTDDLQKFVIAHLKDGLFDEPGVLERAKETAK